MTEKRGCRQNISFELLFLQ